MGLVPPAGIEPAPLASEASALSAELRGLAYLIVGSLQDCSSEQFPLPKLLSIVVRNGGL